MKHIYLSCLLIVAALFAPHTSLMAQTEPSGSCGNNLTWTLAADGTLTISGIGPMSDYSSVPVNGVFTSTAPWITYASQLKRLVISDGVTSIGDFAFDGCSGFTGTLTIPGSVTEIGTNAFMDCSGFTGTLTIPGRVTKIGINAFRSCSGFTGTLIIPEGVTDIGAATFHSCTNLTGEVVIPNSVTSISNWAFAYTGIESIVFGEQITYIPGGVVNGCPIKTITCRSTTPPTTTKNGDIDLSFDGINIAQCTLKIPFGTAGAYSVEPWSSFAKIVEQSKLTLTATTGGTITDAAGNELTSGTYIDANATLKVVPDEGYALSSLTINGTPVTVAEDGTFTLSAETANITISAVFALPTSCNLRILTVGSSIALNLEVPYNGSFTVRPEALDGKTLQSIDVNGDDRLSSLVDGKLTITDIQSDVVIVINAIPSEEVGNAPEHHSDRLTVWSADGRIFVAADAVIRTVELFDLNGRHITTVTANATATDIPAPLSHTSYIIRTTMADGSTRTAQIVVK